MSFDLSISRRLAAGFAANYLLAACGYGLVTRLMPEPGPLGVTAEMAGVMLAVLGSIVVGMWLSRNITTPVRGIGEAMDALAAGSRDIHVPATDRRDEIGRLAKSAAAFRKLALEGIDAKGEAATALKTIEDERKRGEAESQYYVDAHNAFMTRFSKALEEFASGNFTYRLDEPFIKEYEDIRQNYNVAVEKLQAAMRKVVTGAEAIRSETGEIAVSADNQSRRVAQQAANLEEAAAALVEITHGVNKTAEHTAHANTVASSAKSDAEASGTIVRQAVAAMGEIEKSSEQINRIIGVIDEIAFQTNLLALNAGVEAARAGDAGRGFAVVATEVRALAQRSAEAAREIKTLISATTSQIGNGVELVGQSGAALDRILGEMAEISSIVSEIATNAKSQASGLQDVSNTINQMDKATQQNAAVIEETTAASQNLSRETDGLLTLISRFDVGRALEPNASQRRAA